MTAADSSSGLQASESAGPSFFVHFAQPAVLCVLGIAIVLVAIQLARWLYRQVLEDPETRMGRPQWKLNALTRSRKPRRKP